MNETTYTPASFEKVVFDKPHWVITISLDAPTEVWLAHRCISTGLNTARQTYEWRVMVPRLMPDKTKCVFCDEKMPDDIQTLYILLSMK